MHNKLSIFNKSFWGRAAGVTMVTALLLAAMPVASALAASAIIGFFAPGTANSPGRGWSNATNVFTSNNVYATAIKSNKKLISSNFNITAIPSGSTIDGIEVTVEGLITSGSGLQANVALAYVGTTTYTTGTGGPSPGVRPSVLTSTELTYTLGGATSTWGRTWAVGDFTNANFAVKLTSTGSGGTISVDQVKVKIYYTLPNSTITQTAVSGSYGGTASMSATLTDSTTTLPISGQTISFSLNGASVGSAVTNASGVATLASASLSGISAGDYPTGALASFAGGGGYAATSITADLRVIGTATVLTVSPASGTYTGDTGTGTVSLSATLTEGGSPLSGYTIDFNLGGVSQGSATTNASGVATVTGASGNLAGYSAGTFTGEVAASFAGSSSHDMSSGGAALTVNPLTLTVSSTGLTPANKTYDAGTAATLTNGSPTLNAGVISPDVVSLDSSAAAGTFSDANIGTGKTVQISGLTLTGADAGNYSLTQPTRTANITTRPITVTVDAQNKTYGASDPSLTYSITSGTLAVTDTLSGSLTRAAAEDVGTYAITQGTLTARSNYTLNFAGANLTITTHPITVTADAQSKTYGATDPSLTYTSTSGTLAFSDSLSGSLTRDAGEDVGAYAITQGTLALSSNYILNFTGANLTVGTKSIDVAADAKSKTYGASDPAFTYIGDALVGSDSFTGSLTRDAGEDVGAYAITQGTLTAGSNYVLNFTGANLTIGTNRIDVVADAKSKTYGASDPAFTYTADALLGSDTFSGSLARDAGQNAGTHAITQGPLPAGGNYSLNYTGANLSITKAMLTVAADNQAINVGDSDPTFSFSYSSFAGSDDETVIDTDPVCSAPDPHPGPGVYSIVCSGGADNNYDFTYVNGTLTVNAVNSPTITATFKSLRRQDGWVLESSETSNKGGTLNSTSTTFNLGDDATKKQYRAILAFNTSTLPDNAIITKITLQIKSAGIVGINPFKTLKKIAVDIREPFFGLKSLLALEDFSAKSSTNSISLNSKPPTSGKVYFTSLSTASFPFLNLAGLTQLRLRFQKDDNNNLVADYMKFFSGNATAASRPTLIIEYHLP